MGTTKLTNSIKILLDIIEKFKIHDLRENPNDLPDDDRSVLVYEEDGIFYVSKYGYVWNPFTNSTCNYKKWHLHCCKPQSSVIAWREIPEVEE